METYFPVLMIEATTHAEVYQGVPRITFAVSSAKARSYQPYQQFIKACLIIRFFFTPSQ